MTRHMPRGLPRCCRHKSGASLLSLAVLGYVASSGTFTVAKMCMKPDPPLSRRLGRWSSVIAARASDTGEDVSEAPLVKLEHDLEVQLQAAEEEHDSSKVRELAQLLVLTKASMGAVAWQASTELQDTVSSSVADTLREFVGKEDFDVEDVAAAVDMKVSAAVGALDNVYLTAEAAAAAPAGTNPIVLTDVMTPIVDQVQVGAGEALLGFTGKEEYEFGDITKEADRRAKAVIADMLGREEYKFGDATKVAVSKAMDAVTSFTGKEDYKFGDVTKTVLRGALSWLEGEDGADKSGKKG